MITGLLIGGMVVNLILFVILLAAIGTNSDHLEHLSHEFHFLTSKINTIMADLKSLQDQVTAENAVIDSAVVLLEGLKTALDAAIASNDPAALQALSDSIGSETQKLADAVAANTPA